MQTHSKIIEKIWNICNPHLFFFDQLCSALMMVRCNGDTLHICMSMKLVGTAWNRFDDPISIYMWVLIQYRNAALWNVLHAIPEWMNKCNVFGGTYSIHMYTILFAQLSVTQAKVRTYTFSMASNLVCVCQHPTTFFHLF